jgi:proteasome lid subunit RPN8/RPN11
MNKLRWILPEDLLHKSIDVMRPHGAVGNEGLALWLGKTDGSTIEITHLIEVSGPGFTTSPLYMGLSIRAMSKLTDLTDQLDRYLVGQIHSHPGTFVELSDLDKAHGIRVPNYLSIVCPYYAQRPSTSLSNCGVHVFIDNNYHRMNSGLVARSIQMSSTRVTKLNCEVPA